MAYMGFAAKRLMTYMHAFQQEEYDNERFMKWMLRHIVFDKRLTIFILAISATSIFVTPLFVSFLTFSAFTVIAYTEKDPRKEAKKKLVLTQRVKRTLAPAIIMLAILGVIPFFTGVIAWLICIQLVPFVLILSNIMLMRSEEKIQQSFLDEAKNKINDLNPTIIAVTGSFGKTSVKHILGHILKSQAPTLITPGSVNTPMGITRVIREQLSAAHKYFIVEMGAYGPGSIARLCDLTSPDYGIISAIGHAHYERFKTLETVAATKFELAQAVLSKKGKMIVHERTLRFENSRRIKDEKPIFFTVVGEPYNLKTHNSIKEYYLKDGDPVIEDIIQSKNGLEVRLLWNDDAYILKAPLYGRHHGHNIALAFITAVQLGIEPSQVETALMSLPQIAHRLEVKKQPDGTTIIDDAYNSNPAGFSTALQLLEKLGTKDAQKILVTPGMVELGQAHDQAHAKAGQHAGEVCDICIVVQPQRIKRFIDGFYQTGRGKTLVEVDTFDEAADRLADFKRVGDVILLENDLPDIYERIPKI